MVSDARPANPGSTRPWSYKPCESDNSLYQILDASGRVIGFMRKGTGGRAEREEFEANAQMVCDAVNGRTESPEQRGIGFIRGPVPGSEEQGDKIDMFRSEC